jgi:hypothetical protein
MNIKYRHKNADFHGLTAKKGRIVRKVRQNNFSVRRGYDDALFIGDNSIRISEKSANTKRYNQTNQGQGCKSQQGKHRSREGCADDQGVASVCDRKRCLIGKIRSGKFGHLNKNLFI